MGRVQLIFEVHVPDSANSPLGDQFPHFAGPRGPAHVEGGAHGPSRAFHRLANGLTLCGVGGQGLFGDDICTKFQALHNEFVMEIVRRTNNHHIGLPHLQHLPEIRVGWHKASTIKILKPTLMKRAACFAGIAQSNKLTRLPVGVRDRIDKHRDAGTGADDCEFAF